MNGIDVWEDFNGVHEIVTNFNRTKNWINKHVGHPLIFIYQKKKENENKKWKNYL